MLIYFPVIRYWLYCLCQYLMYAADHYPTFFGIHLCIPIILFKLILSHMCMEGGPYFILTVTAFSLNSLTDSQRVSKDGMGIGC